MGDNKSLWAIGMLILSSFGALGQHEPLERTAITGKFLHGKLTRFNLDLIPWQNKNDEQSTLLNTYYSRQSVHRGLDEFTVYSQYMGEVMGGAKIDYFVYSADGRLLSEFTVSENCHEFADLGSFYRSNGQFVDDSTYERYDDFGWEADSVIHHLYSKTTIAITRGGKIDVKNVKSRDEVTPFSRSDKDKPHFVFTIVTNAQDGHHVNTYPEQQVDDWLSRYKISHLPDYPIPGSDMNADLYLTQSNCFIEVWDSPAVNGEEYSKSKKAKIDFLKKMKLNLIEIKYGNTPNLDSVMRNKMKLLGIKF